MHNRHYFFIYLSHIAQTKHGVAVRLTKGGRLDDVLSFRRSRTRREKLAEFFSASVEVEKVNILKNIQ
jgi:hypothetical protein